MVQLLSASLPATPHDARRRQATTLDDDGRTRSVGGRVVLVGQPHDPAAERRAGPRDVAAEADEHAGASAGGRGRRGRSAHQALAVAPRSSSTPSGTATVLCVRSTRRSPTGRARHDRNQRRAPTRDELEVTVVAEHLEHAPDRRIHEAVRRGRRGERHVDGVEQGV